MGSSLVEIGAVIRACVEGEQILAAREQHEEQAADLSTGATGDLEGRSAGVLSGEEAEQGSMPKTLPSGMIDMFVEAATIAATGTIYDEDLQASGGLHTSSMLDSLSTDDDSSVRTQAIRRCV